MLRGIDHSINAGTYRPDAGISGVEKVGGWMQPVGAVPGTWDIAARLSVLGEGVCYVTRGACRATGPGDGALPPLASTHAARLRVLARPGG
jgi:hypothetical protein